MDQPILDFIDAQALKILLEQKEEELKFLREKLSAVLEKIEKKDPGPYECEVC